MKVLSRSALASSSLLGSLLGSLLCAACGTNTIDTTGTGGTTGSPSTTTSSSGSTGSGSGTTGAAGTTTSAGTTNGSSCGITVPNYPGDSCSWSVAQGKTFPDVSLSGGAALNFSTTVTPTSTNNLASSFSFEQLHALTAQGFRYAFIDVSAVWCPNCQAEASVLPGSYTAQWLSQGGLIFSVLVQSDTSAPATVSDLNAWISTYQINYPMSLDNQENMVYAQQLEGWPSNVIIRLCDMAVLFNGAGQGTSNYDLFETTLSYCQQNADCASGAVCE